MADGAMIPMNESGRVLKILDSILRQGLARFATLYNVVPSEALPGIWLEALRDLKPEILAGALLRVEKEFVPTNACPFPVPAHIRQVLAGVNDNEKKVLTEAAWQKALHWSRREWHPDLLPGSRLSPLPELPRKIHHALGAAGGPAHLFECSEEETQWARKRFIEAYEQFSQLEEDEFFLSDGEAKSVLQNLLSTQTAKQLVKGKTM